MDQTEASGLTMALSSAAFHILVALADEDRHGYGIMQDVVRHTQGAMRLNSGTLYRSIKQLLAAGLIAEADERPDPALDDERRRYYRLTPAGRHAAEAEAARLDHLVAIARAKHLLRPASASRDGAAR